MELTFFASLLPLFCRTTAFWHSCPGLSKLTRVALIVASCGLLWNPQSGTSAAGFSLLLGEAVHGVLLAVPLLMLPVVFGVIGMVLDVVAGFTTSSISNPVLGAQRSAVWGALIREVLWVKVVNAGLLSVSMTVLLNSYAEAPMDIAQFHGLIAAGIQTSYASLSRATAVIRPFLVCICVVEAVHLVANHLIAGADMSTVVSAVKTLASVLFFMVIVTYGWTLIIPQRAFIVSGG